MDIQRPRRFGSIYAEPKKYYPNPSDENDYWWIASGYDEPIMLNQNLFPEVTFENSPMEVELKLVNDVQG